MKAVLVAAGAIRQGAWLEQQLDSADLLIAVDGGLRHVLAAGRQPDLIVGDLDSVLQSDLARVPDLPRATFSPEKDLTDLELATAHALEAGATQLVLVAALGDRRDQGLVNMLMAAVLRRDRQVDVLLAGAGTICIPLDAGGVATLPCPAGTVFSLVALQDGCRASIRGARYDLSDQPVEFGTGLGISNVAGGSTSVTVHTGLALLMIVSEDV